MAWVRWFQQSTVAPPRSGCVSAGAAQPARTIDTDGGSPGTVRVARTTAVFILITSMRPAPAATDTNLFGVSLTTTAPPGARRPGQRRHRDEQPVLGRLAIDQTTGDIALSWYDCRQRHRQRAGDLDGTPTPIPSSSAPLSFDGGVTFSQFPDRRRPSSAIANPTAANDYGDYTGLASMAASWSPPGRQLQQRRPKSRRRRQRLRRLHRRDHLSICLRAAAAAIFPTTSWSSTKRTIKRPTSASSAVGHDRSETASHQPPLRRLADYDWFRLTPSQSARSMSLNTSSP